MAVGRDDRHAIALPDPHLEQRVGLLVDALAELAPAEALIAIDHCLGIGVQLRRASQEIGDEQRDFHVNLR